MRIDERLRDGDPIVSFEFSPPRTVEAELAFWTAIEELATLEPAKGVNTEKTAYLLATAAYLGATRLIDNIILDNSSVVKNKT